MDYSLVLLNSTREHCFSGHERQGCMNDVATCVVETEGFSASLPKSCYL